MPFQEGGIFFNKIFVIQSLDDNDRKTGTELHSDTISRMAWKDPQLKTEFADVNSKQELLDRLQMIKEEAIKGILPFIHLETHGSENGIVLRSGEEMSWGALAPILTSINIASRNNTFVSVASCWGGNIQHQIKVDMPSPYRGFIGPMAKLYPSDILATYTAFFEELLRTDDFEQAIVALNNSNSSNIEFHHMNSEVLFDVILDNYRKAFGPQSSENQVLRKTMLEGLLKESEFIKVNEKDFEVFMKKHYAQLIAKLESLRKQFLHQNY